MLSTMLYTISPGLCLVRQLVDVKTAPAKKEKDPVNHLIIIDCSGSMASDLPKIREQLKRKMPKLIGPQDTISLIWFSGRSQFGTLLEAEPVANLVDLQILCAAIDKWLQPIGMTGFKEPIEEVGRLIRKIRSKNQYAFSLFFMSDGCDNQWNHTDIFHAVSEVAPLISSATFVEYGYYADRATLTKMAAVSGGSLIFAKDFDSYQPVFEGALGKVVSSVNRREVEVVGRTEGDFVFAIDGDNRDLVTFAVSFDPSAPNRGTVSLPENTSEIWRITDTATAAELCSLGKAERDPQAVRTSTQQISTALYAAVSLFSIRMKPDVLLPILKFLGDVEFIDTFAGCFGKQRYSDFMDMAKAAVFQPNLRLLKGYDPTKVPADDVFTVFDLLHILAEDEDNRLMLAHPEFIYKRIGRGRINADEVLTEEDSEAIEDITEQLKLATTPAEVQKLQQKLSGITEKKVALKFEPNDEDAGYPFDALVYNEDRPNISVRVRKTGSVDISAKVPKNLSKKLPTKFPTFIYRNYTIVCDGILNVEHLPVRVTKATKEKLKALVPDDTKFKVKRGTGLYEVVLDLTRMPVINRKMVTEVSARSLFTLQWDLMKARAAQKVCKFFLDEVQEKKESPSYELTYGDVGAAWLKEAGFTDYSGFSPNVVLAPATDVYFGKELAVSIKGLSALPSVNDVKSRIASGKAPTLSQSLMIPIYQEILAEKTKMVGNKNAASVPFYVTWLERRAKDASNDVRRLLFQISRIKMTVVLGQIWFKEFSSLQENSLTMDFDSVKGVPCVVSMKEVEVKV